MELGQLGEDLGLAEAGEEVEAAWAVLPLGLAATAYVHHVEQQCLISWLHRAARLNVQNAECQ
jgi:hypothetical protein